MTITPVRPTALHAYLSYRDAPAALRWLERDFGFTTTIEFPDDKGGIMHAELRLGDAAIMVFSDADGSDRSVRKGETVVHGLYLGVDNDATVDALHARAAQAGATVIWAPAANEWGSYRFRVLDCRTTNGPSAPIAPARPRASEALRRGEPAVVACLGAVRAHLRFRTPPRGRDAP